MRKKENAILRIREFNRFYMPALDLLGNHYLGSEYSAVEARVLFEVYEKDGCNAAYIAKTMNIDKSYLSRIIKSHEKNGYLVRVKSVNDSRSFDIHLTEAGLKRTMSLIQKANLQIEHMLGPLDEHECQRLIDALNVTTEILKECNNVESQTTLGRRDNT